MDDLSIGAASPAKPLPTVSVVMATYRRRSLLPRVVDSLLADPATSELVVVVDGCRDGSLELLQERAGDDPRVVPVFTENRGAAAAQQLGIEHARGDVVLLFDDDQIAAPGMVTGHARHHADAAHRVVVGYVPVELPPPGPGRFLVESYARDYEADLAGWERDPASILTNLWGGQVSLRREDLERVPWHDPRFDLGYHYDNVFGLRCRDAGLTAVFDRGLRAEHLYTRTLDAMLREAYVKGRAMHRHRALHGADASFHLLDGHHPVGRAVTRMLGPGPARPVLLELLVTATRWAGALRMARVERNLAHAIWVAEARRGFREGARAAEPAAAAAQPPGTGP